MKNVKRKLLIIEDNELNREILCSMLEDDYQLFEATNGQEGLEVMRSHASELSVVLLDIQMPVMNGYQVLEAVGKDKRLKEIPIIVTTGSGRLEEEEYCLQLGATDFIQKPYNPNIVHCRIENIIHLQEKTAALNEVEIDPVVGIYTRSAFTHYAIKLIKENPDIDYTLIMSDIVGFQRQVEIFGEKAFEILRNEAIIVKRRLHPLAAYGRYSFDQLICLLPNLYPNMDDKEQLKHYDAACTRLSEQVGAIVKFGVCQHIQNPDELESCINRTRKALSAIKHQYGRNTGFVNDELLAHMKRSEEIEMAMERAVKEHQLEIYFQPKHHTISGKLIGAEVLLRWQHPTMGLIPSREFVPVFEETGFIVEADAYAWQEACRFLKEIKAKGLPLFPLSVNTTRLDFERPGFEERLLTPLRENGIHPELLHIEVTEQLFAELGNDAIDILQRCRQLGIKVELDDFGTGYSSLHSLAEIPIDIVKFDQSFVRKLDNERQMEVMKGCVNLVKRLKLMSVAEGVETEDSRQQIINLGIDQIQGYLYAKPMPANEFEEYIRKSDVITLQEYIEMEEDPHQAELDRLRRLAEEDPLTGLSNRYRLFNIVNNRLQARKAFTLVIFDIDKFKAINDTYGHLMGDKVLIKVAETMRAGFGKQGLIRLGGDEFAIIFDGIVGYAQMMNEMQSFFYHIQQIRIDGLSASTRITLSAGCTCYRGYEETTFEQLYSQADKSLYNSKGSVGCCLNYADSNNMSSIKIR